MKSIAAMLLGLALLGMSTAPSRAQEHEDHPSRVRSISSRAVCSRRRHRHPRGGWSVKNFSDRFGKPFVVENRPGARTVARSSGRAQHADGYTIMMATSGTLAMNPTLYKKLPYDPGELSPVGGADPHGGRSCSWLTRPGSFGCRPGQAREGAAAELRLGGAGAFLWASCSRPRWAFHDPRAVQGHAAALNDVIAGHIQLMFSDLAPAYPLSYWQGARARRCATRAGGAGASAACQSDRGLWAAWQSVVVPGETPKDIIAKLNGAVNGGDRRARSHQAVAF